MLALVNLNFMQAETKSRPRPATTRADGAHCAPSAPATPEAVAGRERQGLSIKKDQKHKGTKSKLFARVKAVGVDVEVNLGSENTIVRGHLYLVKIYI